MDMFIKHMNLEVKPTACQHHKICGEVANQLLAAILQILQHNLCSGGTRAFEPRNSARYFGLIIHIKKLKTGETQARFYLIQIQIQNKFITNPLANCDRGVLAPTELHYDRTIATFISAITDVITKHFIQNACQVLETEINHDNIECGIC